MNTGYAFTSLGLLLALLVLAGCPGRSIAEEKRTMDTAIAAATGTQDFDFLAGSWLVANRRLKVRHAASDDWDEFPGSSEMRRILGGVGNVDEIEFPTKGWSGATFRLFNPESRKWSIYWANSRDGLLQAPVFGSFANGVGEFFGDDLDEGRAVRVRYRWSEITADSARWDQAFSLDAGKTWETNWVMELRRAW